MMQVLQQVAGSVATPPKFNHAEKAFASSTSDAGVEVMEIQDSPTSNHMHKHKPNDKITIKYADGRIVSEVKYKKVKEDVDSGKAIVVG